MLCKYKCIFLMVVKRFQNVLIKCVVHFVFMLVNKSVNKWVFAIYSHFTHLFTLKKLIINIVYN